MDQTVGIDSTNTGTRGKYEKGIQTRTLILGSAVELFASRGYGGCSVAELAAAANCSKNQLFHHFGSKEDLAIEAVQAAFGMWRTAVAAPTAVYANPLTRLDRVILLVRQLEIGGWPATRLLSLMTLTTNSLPERLKLSVRAIMREIAGFTDALSQQACRLTTGIPVSEGQLSQTVRCLIFGWDSAGTSGDRQEQLSLTELLGLESR